jgi:hypothetical protein
MVLYNWFFSNFAPWVDECILELILVLILSLFSPLYFMLTNHFILYPIFSFFSFFHLSPLSPFSSSSNSIFTQPITISNQVLHRTILITVASNNAFALFDQINSILFPIFHKHSLNRQLFPHHGDHTSATQVLSDIHE